MNDVTQILSRIESGDPTAAEQLLPLVYDELRKLAAAAAGPGEAWANAAGDGAGARGVSAAGRRRTRPSIGTAAATSLPPPPRPCGGFSSNRRAAKGGTKRGGELQRVELDEDRCRLPRRRRTNLLAVDEALAKLAARRPDRGRAGQAALFCRPDQSPRRPRRWESRRATADRHWAYARAWLLSEFAATTHDGRSCEFHKFFADVRQSADSSH